MKAVCFAELSGHETADRRMDQGQREREDGKRGEDDDRQTMIEPVGKASITRPCQKTHQQLHWRHFN